MYDYLFWTFHLRIFRPKIQAKKKCQVLLFGHKNIDLSGTACAKTLSQRRVLKISLLWCDKVFVHVLLGRIKVYNEILVLDPIFVMCVLPQFSNVQIIRCLFLKLRFCNMNICLPNGTSALSLEPWDPQEYMYNMAHIIMHTVLFGRNMSL